MSWFEWLKANHDPILAVASIVGNAITLAALVTTIFLSSCQLDLTRQSIQNNLIYNMQKDEREVAAAYYGGKLLDTGPIFAQMQSVFLQKQIGSIPKEVWSVFQQDFCSIMSTERLKRDWASIDKDSFSPQFISYVNQLAAQNPCNRGAS